MNELFFPLFGTAVVVLLVLPLASLVSKVCLVGLDRLAGGRIMGFEALRYLLLVLPTFLPLLWCLSAALHQAETGRAVLACLFLHDIHELCVEPVLFAGLLLLVIVVRGSGWVGRVWLACRVRGKCSGNEAERVTRLLAEHPELLALTRRILITERPVGGSATVGLVQPVVVLDADFVRLCDDETLVGALAHELEHVRAKDPLRYLLLSLAMRLNPAGEWLLRRHANAWTFGRELECDRAAVLGGAEPFGVAGALLKASRPAHGALAHIRGGAAAKLRLRVELLLAYAEQKPVAQAKQRVSALVLTAIVALSALTVPHVGGTYPLDTLHSGVERIVASALD